jgi:hypothetical protein
MKTSSFFATPKYRVPSPGLYPFDLHVLSTPPAFVLSQDQTLKSFPEKLKYSLTESTSSFQRTKSPTMPWAFPAQGTVDLKVLTLQRPLLNILANHIDHVNYFFTLG